MRSIYLTMIVKNEAHVIRRCLDSVLPFITGYQIVDTGSTDDTPNIIRRHLDHLPGEVTSHSWVDFSYNRNLAIDLARGKSDYLLTMDADETITPNALPEDMADGLICPTQDIGRSNRYSRIRFFKNDGSFRYIGKVHEAITSLRKVNLLNAQAPIIFSHYDSNRNVLGDKLFKDLKVLLLEPPTARNLFYLGQTYMNLARHEEAIRVYKQRVELGGFMEEVYLSLFNIGRSYLKLEQPGEALGHLFQAYSYMPQRYEALDLMCQMFSVNKNFQMLERLIPNSFPPYVGSLFIDDLCPIRLQEMKAHMFLATNRKTEAATLFESLLAMPLSPEWKEKLTAALGQCK